MKKTTEKKGNTSPAIEINILPLLLELLKKIWLILIFGIVFGVMAFSFTKVFVHPTYRCSFTAYVNNQHAAQSSKESLTSSDMIAAKELVQTYSKILTSNTILTASAEWMDSSYTSKQLQKMVGTQIQSNTEIIQVYVIAKSPEESYKIATSIANVAPKHMADIVEGSSMKIVDYPQVPDGIYQPSYMKYTLIGAVIGMFLIVAILVIRYMVNDTITDENELEEFFSVPVVGIIPDVNSVGNSKASYYYYYEETNKGEQQGEKA